LKYLNSFIALIFCILLGSSCQNKEKDIAKKWFLKGNNFFLLIHPNGKYFCQENYNHQKGNWKLNSNQDSIYFYPLESHSTQEGSSFLGTAPFGAKIQKISSEKCVLILFNEDLELFTKKALNKE